MECAMTDRAEGDRRQVRRSRDPFVHGIQAVRVRPGHAAAVIDASPAAALIETAHRLLPGTFVELHMETVHLRTTMRGRVARCAVVQVRAASVLYRGAIVFDRHLPWYVPEDGYPLHSSDQSEGHRRGAAATRTVV
jgi:hypothetical protein